MWYATRLPFASGRADIRGAVVFISCKPPVDPVKLVTTHVQNVVNTGVTNTR